MSRIVHISLKVDDIQSTGQFYQQVFGFQDAITRKTRDHLSRHMSDGSIDFTLMAYDEGTQSAESTASGDGPCIHHFGLEVEDIPKATELIRSYGCEIVSDPGVIPVKFRDPGGTICELVQIGRYKIPDSPQPPDRIVDLALKVDDVERTASFYKDVFGFVDREGSADRGATARRMSDGVIDFTLLKADSGAARGPDGTCIHHFAVGVEDLAQVTDQLRAYGSEITSAPGAVPVRFRAPGGTNAELVPARSLA